jgi:hypothetical protein
MPDLLLPPPELVRRAASFSGGCAMVRFSHRQIWFSAVFSVFVGLTFGLSTVDTARACPFCTAQALTMTEEIDTSVVSVVATLTKVPDNNQQPVDPNESLAPCEFTIDRVIKGADVLGDEKIVKTLYLGQGAKGSKFLITAIPSEQSKIIWAAPIALPERGVEYLDKVLKLPKEGPERLVFFQDYLQDKDDLLARDAYDEVVKIPYDTIRQAKDKLRRKDFIKWIQDPETTASKRRMFFSLLSVCGEKEDVPMIEKMIRSTDRRDRSGLDSMLNCYMSLLGEDAMPLIEELFLKDPKVDYTDRYSAIMAIRFQGTDGKAVPRERLVKSLRLNLDHPKVADLVVMDLARWKDWESMERLVEMFKKSTDETIFIREPVINYLRICPRSEAKKHLDELAKMDPIAFQRALSMMQLPASSSSSSDNEKNDKAATSGDATKPEANQTNTDKQESDANTGAKKEPAATEPAKPATETSSSQLRQQTVKRPTIALAGMGFSDAASGESSKSVGKIGCSFCSGAPATKAVAAAFVVLAIGGAVVSIRRK